MKVCESIEVRFEFKHKKKPFFAFQKLITYIKLHSQEKYTLTFRFSFSVFNWSCIGSNHTEKED